MSGSVNKVILVGNLGKDPEIRHLQTGIKIASFSLATSESWKDKETGERKERSEWHRVEIMNEKLSELVEKYVRKGSKVYVEGQLQTHKWTDQSGQERYTTKVIIGRFSGSIVLLSHLDNDKSSKEGSTNKTLEKTSYAYDDLDDNVPF